jgi:hypothetical protein
MHVPYDVYNVDAFIYFIVLAPPPLPIPPPLPMPPKLTPQHVPNTYDNDDIEGKIRFRPN